jgi:hypothetical protein
MPIVDYTKAAVTLNNALKRFCKSQKGGCNVGEIRDSFDRGVYWFEFDNDGLLASEMAGIVQKDPYAKLLHQKDHGGVYDWSSDTYIRPCSTVSWRY